MTQGNERGTPDDDAADERDPAVPGDPDGSPATDVTAGHGAPDERPADAPADGPDTPTPALPHADAVGEDPARADVVVEPTGADAVADPDGADAAADPDGADAAAVRPADAAPDGAPGADEDVADTPAGGRRTGVVAGPRPLAPVAAEHPLTAWPSWDDVAVTAPAADAAQVDDAPADDQAQAEAPEGDAAPTPDAAGQATAGPVTDDTGAASSPAHDAAAPAGTADQDDATDPDDAAASEEVPAALPPLNVGGLSALAFAGLNAASVGVAAHALPRSPLPDAEAPAVDNDPADAGTTASDTGTSAAVASADEAAADADAPSTDTSDDATPEVAAPAAGAPGAAPTTSPGTAPDAAPDSATPASREDATTVLAPTPAAPDEPAAATTTVLPPADGVADDDATRALPVAAATAGAGRTLPDAAPGAAGAGGTDGDAPDGPGRTSSPLDVFEEEPVQRRWPRTLAIVGGVVVLLGGLYVGGSYAFADRVPRGATVAGVEIGGLSSDEARAALTSGLADRTSQALPVVAQDVQADLDPVAAGLTLDTDATVDRLTGVDLAQPVRLWRQVAGVGEQPPVTQVDDAALEAALTQLEGALTLAPVDGTVVFADGAAHATDAVDGWQLDPDAAAETVVDGWLTRTRPLELPTTVLAPAVSQEETQRALEEIAQPLAAAPVTVTVAERQAVLDVPTLTASAAVVPVEGTLELQLDGQALTDAVLGQLPDLLTTAADARFEFQGGAPVIVPGVAGTTLDPATLASSVAQAAAPGAERTAAVELVQSDPAETTEALEALGVVEVVSEFSTPLTSEPRRTSNISTGLGNITGTLVRPGETFSLTDALGPIDAAHGFVQAGAIVNGQHTDAWGGGLSQVSTTTYNAAYFAGFEDVEHQPHSEWFQRYPEGREATIFTGVIDMRWKNNTPYGALVQGFVEGGRAHVRIWGTKHFTVETEKSGRSGVVAPTTVYSQSATCEAQSAGNPGFTVTNTRRVLLNGEVVDTESNTWRYKPQNRVVCGAPPSADPPAAPAP